MRTFRTVYNFARTITDNAIPENPVQRLSQTRQWCKIERRKTFIRPHELKSWYEAVQKIENPVIREFLLLILFTGLRKSEGLTMKWACVDMRDKSFTITDTKNGLPHTLPISAYLFDLFERLQTIRINEYVFPGSGATGHLVETRKQIDFVEKQTCFILNEVSDQAELNVKIDQDPDSVLNGVSFTLHDLRRTFITVAESLEISYAALKKLLNHSDGNDVTGGYLQITTDRLRDPMERISNKLMELTGIPLPTQEQNDSASQENS
jgi:integrase